MGSRPDIDGEVQAGGKRDGLVGRGNGLVGRLAFLRLQHLHVADGGWQGEVERAAAGEAQRIGAACAVDDVAGHQRRIRRNENVVRRAARIGACRTQQRNGFRPDDGAGDGEGLGLAGAGVAAGVAAVGEQCDRFGKRARVRGGQG